MGPAISQQVVANMIYKMIYNSPLGTLTLEAEDSSLIRISFGTMDISSINQMNPVLEKTIKWLDSYFKGENPIMDIPMVFHGTLFQKDVWNMLLEIPYGTITTYGDISKRLAIKYGKEKMSAQAVGQAVGKNPIAILVPCHRVLGKNNIITGYAGGLDKKEYLLNLEGISYMK